MNTSNHSSGLLGAWRRLDRHLLLNQPRLWAMRFHSALALGLLATIASLIIAAFIPVSADNVPVLRPFFLSLAALAAIASLYWAWLQFRVLRHASVRGRDGGGLTFVLNLVCLAAINLPSLAATSVLRERIVQTVPYDQLTADQKAFDEGVTVWQSYDPKRETYRCLPSQRKEMYEERFCPGPVPAPALVIPDELSSLKNEAYVMSRIDCDECEAATARIEKLMPVAERYGQADAPRNLANLQIAHAVHDTVPSRYHLFLAWFLSLTIATVLTLARTTCVRAILEVAAVVAAAWLSLTFLSTAYEAHHGVSSILTLAVCALAVPLALVGRMTRPLALPLLIAACLLAPTATIIAGMIAVSSRDLLDRTDVVESLNQFSTPWSSIDTTTFFSLIGAATVVVFAMLALYRPVGQRMAAGPKSR